MAKTSQAQIRAQLKYAKKALHRVPLDLSNEKYQAVKAAADLAGESVNGYIKKAIDMRMDAENMSKNAEGIENIEKS